MQIRTLSSARFDIQNLNYEKTCKNCKKYVVYNKERKIIAGCEVLNLLIRFLNTPDDPLIIGNFCKDFDFECV